MIFLLTCNTELGLLQYAWYCLVSSSIWGFAGQQEFHVFLDESLTCYVNPWKVHGALRRLVTILKQVFGEVGWIGVIVVVSVWDLCRAGGVSCIPWWKACCWRRNCVLSWKAWNSSRTATLNTTFFGGWCLDDIRTLLLQGRSNFMHTMIEAEESIMECMVFLLLCNPKARSCCNCLLIFSFLQ